MVEALKKNQFYGKRQGPVVLCIMDGVGYGKYAEGDAFKAAITETLDGMMETCPVTALKAHGTSVGLPDDSDMGNSEVGHNAIGCGRVFAQGARLVNDSIGSRRVFTEPVWKKLTKNAKDNNSTLHLIGLLSDGGVHSHINQLKGLIEQAKKEGIPKVRVHALLDGRDVGPTSALEYFDPFAEYLSDLSDDNFNACIASGGGRMVITMDRYGANWGMVEKGWQTHVLGEGRTFTSSHDAIVTLREETEALDQDLPPFVIEDASGKPVGSMQDGDSVILFNYRGDRALEISMAFDGGDEFDKFDRKFVPKVEYAGLMEYDGDIHIPKQYLVSPPDIDRTMAEYLCATGVKQFSISETQKFGHITYFFNGNKSGKFSEELEDYVEIPSDVCPYEQRPAMKCAEITDRLLGEIEGGDYKLIKLNFPNGDMVGHTGVFQAVVCSLEAMDLSISRLKKAIKAAGGILILSADHGNSDDMFEHDKKTGDVKKKNGKIVSKTSHSLNPVPCIIFDPQFDGEYDTKLNEGLGISSLAATTMNLMGYEAPEDYDKSIVNFK
jgi:2,3-bisphosphoglycerate-independent phosphoglycerate mutase